jgi:hypothetical protein
MAFCYITLLASLIASALGALWQRAIDQVRRRQAARSAVLRAGTSAWTLRTPGTADPESLPMER